MAHWLLKTEPSTYSFGDLVREGTTAWSGVRNPTARRNLQAMAAGDLVVVYHSGEKAAVGLGAVARTAYPEPGGDAGAICVDVKAGAPLAAPVSLAALRTSAAFEGSPLLSQGRLSVVPLSAAQWKALLALGSGRA
jgi:predicted RNA-binding protein with PUA-like domain